MRAWFLLATGLAGCGGLLGLDEVTYREPVVGGAGGTGGGEEGGGGQAPLEGTPRWLYVVDDQDGTTDGRSQRGADGAFDVEGRAVIALTFDGTLNVPKPTPSSSAAPNVLLVTLDENGHHVRHRNYGGSKEIDVRIATLGDDIAAAGAHHEPSPINVGGQDLAAACTLEVEQTDCPPDAYVLKYDEDLDYRWHRRTGTGTGTERATAIAALPDGVVVAGTYDSAISIFGKELPYAAGGDAFLVRLLDEDTGITVEWTTSWNGTESDLPVAVDVREATVAVALQTGSDLVVRAIQPANGSEKWVKPPAFRGNVAGLDVAVAPDGSVVVVARLTGESTTPDVETITPMGAHDLLLIRIGSSGSVERLLQLPVSTALWNAQIAIDDQGHIALGGSFQGTLDLGDGDLLDTGDAILGFVAKLDADGTPIWSRLFAPPGAATGASLVNAIDVTPDGEILAVGTFSGTIDFELTQEEATPSTDPDNALAVFATRFAP